MKSAMFGFRPLILAGLLAPLFQASALAAGPETVYFNSGDKTEIVGYLYKPSESGVHPAIVLLHGRAGPYSANDNADCTFVRRTTLSPCNATTLSKRHQMWGQFWADHGYLALLPDSFGPRGKAHGFGRFSHDDPERDSVNELTVRPLDAEGALAYLLSRRDVVQNRVFLQGWSNGGSTTLNVMMRQGTHTGFHAAFAFYPGCGKEALLAQTITASASITMLLGSVDEEVSPAICLHVAERSAAVGAPVTSVLYPGATHDFDDPGEARQSVPSNAAAKADAMRRVLSLVDAVR